MRVRARGQFPFFKIVLLTNASGLDLPSVQYGLQFFTGRDEIWAKLDAGTQAYMDRINRSQVSLEQILGKILLVARKRQVVIQSLFPTINGQEPPPEEIRQEQGTSRTDGHTLTAARDIFRVAVPWQSGSATVPVAPVGVPPTGSPAVPALPRSTNNALAVCWPR